MVLFFDAVNIQTYKLLIGFETLQCYTNYLVVVTVVYKYTDYHRSQKYTTLLLNTTFHLQKILTNSSNIRIGINIFYDSLVLPTESPIKMLVVSLPRHTV